MGLQISLWLTEALLFHDEVMGKGLVGERQLPCSWLGKWEGRESSLLVVVGGYVPGNSFQASASLVVFTFKFYFNQVL